MTKVNVLLIHHSSFIASSQPTPDTFALSAAEVSLARSAPRTDSTPTGAIEAAAAAGMGPRRAAALFSGEGGRLCASAAGAGVLQTRAYARGGSGKRCGGEEG